MTVDVEKLLCDSVTKLEAFTRQRRELDLHLYVLIDIMMRKIDTLTRERRNLVAQEFSNAQIEGGEPQQSCTSNAERHRLEGLAEHSQMLMAEGTSVHESTQLSGDRAFGDDAPGVPRSGATDTFCGVAGFTNKNSLSGDIVLDGDSMASNVGTDGVAQSTDEGIHTTLDEVVNVFGDALALGGLEPSRNKLSYDISRNATIVLKNSVETPVCFEDADTTTFKVEEERSTMRERLEHESNEALSLRDDSRDEPSSALRAQQPAVSDNEVCRGITWKSPKSDKSPLFDSNGLTPVETLSTSSCRSRERVNIGELPEERTSRSYISGDGDRFTSAEAEAASSPRNLLECVDYDSQHSSATLERSCHEEILSRKKSSEDISLNVGDHECEAQEGDKCATDLLKQPVYRFLDWFRGLKRPRSEQDLAAVKDWKRLRCSSESALSSKGSPDNNGELFASGLSASSESVGVNFEIVKEGDTLLTQRDRVDVTSDGCEIEDAPLPDLFDIAVLKNAIVSAEELPNTSNLLQLPGQQLK
ncbi:uncharacterized protein LOC142804162 isoform X1 [Rhipicephalus microplus]|uniref:uncharacterized protein LOC142804162 isoform X1 n=1 Tax=Rhipicephalus microplus TaxID=6941 RepID=UPI003F6B8200